jgi:hypothetical protein
MKVITFSSTLIVFMAIITFLIVPAGQAFAQSSISVSSSQNQSAPLASNTVSSNSSESTLEFEPLNDTLDTHSSVDSRFCNIDNLGLHCSSDAASAVNNQLPSTNNIILERELQPNFSSISTAFRINETNETTSNNIAVIYSLVDQPVDKYAGINIINNSVFVIFYDINNGTVTNDPQYPGQLTDLLWTPGSLFNMSVIRENSSINLVLNGTAYYSKPIEGGYDEPGYVGMYFDVVPSIDIYDFKKVQLFDPVVTGDTETILLDGYELPESSYIHLYDSTPYEIRSGHIAAKLPCEDINVSNSILVVAGKAPNLSPLSLELVSELSTPGDMCLYHGDIVSASGRTITDIALQNNSTENIEFPETSNIVISVSEIARLPH